MYDVFYRDSLGPKNHTTTFEAGPLLFPHFFLLFLSSSPTQQKTRLEYFFHIIHSYTENF